MIISIKTTQNRTINHNFYRGKYLFLRSSIIGNGYQRSVDTVVNHLDHLGFFRRRHICDVMAFPRILSKVAANISQS